MKNRIILTVGLLISSSLLHAEERLEMEGTTVRGNQELPKVLYIVPWQQSDIPNVTEPPLESLIDEALAPLDREVFQRQVRYYDELSAQDVRNNENQ